MSHDHFTSPRDQMHILAEIRQARMQKLREMRPPGQAHDQRPGQPRARRWQSPITAEERDRADRYIAAGLAQIEGPPRLARGDATYGVLEFGPHGRPSG